VAFSSLPVYKTRQIPIEFKGFRLGGLPSALLVAMMDVARIYRPTRDVGVHPTGVLRMGPTEKTLNACSHAVLGWHTYFNQTRHFLNPLGLSRGHCHGLSLSWLAARRSWALKQRFFVKSLRTKATSGKSSDVSFCWDVVNKHLAQENVSPEGFKAEVGKAGFTVGNDDLFQTSELDKLAFAIQSAPLGSYWMIHTGNHVMAATCYGLTIYFFDPNGGEVCVTGGVALYYLLKKYLLESPRIKAAYLGSGYLTLQRLKTG
jgi:hypothetical protein